MDELIAAFLEHVCTIEYANEAYRSFKICNDFEYPDLYSSFIDILTNESFISTDELKDSFNHELHDKLNSILKQHNLELTALASLFQKNEMLSALYTIQSLEDYSSVIAVLQSLETDEVKLTTILEDYCQLDMSEQMTIIKHFEPTTLDLLKEYIQRKTALVTEESSYRNLIPAIKVFFTLFGKDNVGYALIDNDIKPGQSIDLYLNYIDNIVAKTLDQTAINVLSLIYLTPESIQSPLAVFNQHSLQMLKDLALVPKVETLVLRMVSKVEEYLKAQQQVPQ